MKNKLWLWQKKLLNILINQQISASVFRVIVAICLLPILILSLSFILFYISDNEKKTNDYFESNRQLSVNQIHELFVNYENETRLLTQPFTSLAGAANDLSDTYIRSTLSSILSSNSEITAVTFQSNELEQYIESRSSFNQESYDLNFGTIDPTKREVLVRPLKMHLMFGEQQPLIVVSRNIYNPYLLQGTLPLDAYKGTIFLFIKAEAINRIIQTNSAYQKLNYYLLYNNRVIYTPASTQKYLTLSKEALLEKHQDNSAWSIKNSNSPSNYLNRFEIITVTQKPALQIFAQPKYWLFSLVSLVIALLIPLTIYRLINKIIINPIEILVLEIGQVEKETTLIDTTKLPNNEIRFLSRQINQMLVDLYDNSKKLREAEVKQKESELKSLKSQLQPHYLYNTLEVIRMSAIMNQDMIVAKMVQHLSSQLEYVLRNTDQELVTVQEEVNNIMDYLELINVRYEVQIAYQLDFEEQIKALKIPRLTLQPLVENAVKHGLKEQGNQGLITVTGYLETDVAVIEIFDNGVGLTEDELVSLREHMKVTTNHLGLGIVHLRIQHHYGDEYGLTISSKKNEWTLIRILIPREEQTNV